MCRFIFELKIFFPQINAKQANFYVGASYTQARQAQPSDFYKQCISQGAQQHTNESDEKDICPI